MKLIKQIRKPVPKPTKIIQPTKKEKLEKIAEKEAENDIRNH